MKKPLPKRFYKEASVGEREGGFAIELDGKPVKTPARQPLVVPTEALATLIAAEWQRQAEVIDPAKMPVTRLVNTALDGIAADPQAVFEDIVRFLLQRSALLSRRQVPSGWWSASPKRWDPVIDWAAQELGARFILAEGVMHQEQPREAIAAFAVTVRKYDTPMELAVPAYHHVAHRLGASSRSLSPKDTCRSPTSGRSPTSTRTGRSSIGAAMRRPNSAARDRFVEYQAATDVFSALRS